MVCHEHALPHSSCSDILAAFASTGRNNSKSGCAREASLSSWFRSTVWVSYHIEPWVAMRFGPARPSGAGESVSKLNPPCRLTDDSLDQRRDDYYVSKMALGTPPQSFPCLIDIGWNDMLVPSINCSSLDCFSRPKYAASASSTHQSSQDMISIFYWTTQSWGLRSQESLHIADLTIPGYVFGEASDVEGWLWPEDSSPISVLGLARVPYNTRWSNLSSLNSFQRMLKDDILEHRVFSLKLPQSDSEAGELLFGAVNNKYLRGQKAVLDINGHTIDPRNEWLSGGWQVQAQSAGFGADITGDLSNQSAIFTTIFPEVTLPRRLLKDFEAKLDGEILMDVHCDKRHLLPDFTLTLGTDDRSFSFVLSPWDYIRPSHKSVRGCRTIFVDSDEDGDGGYIRLGSFFLDRYYNVFDAGGMTVTSKSSRIIIAHVVLTIHTVAEIEGL